MNILYITPRFPYPPNQGDKVVVYNHLKFLSAANKITLLSIIRDKGEAGGIPHISDYCSRIEVFKKRPNLSAANFFTVAFKKDPFTVIRYYSPEMFRRSKELIESGEFDVVHTAFYYMGQYAIDKKITVPGTTAVILDTHNIEYLVYSRAAQLERNPFIKLFMKLETMRIKAYEFSMHKKFDKCIAFSELDRKNIAAVSGASNIAVNPACIELPAARQADERQREEKDTVLFFGLLNTFANDDAVRFFYEDILPIIRKEITEVKFILAGKYPTRYTVNLKKDPGVRFLGAVPDMGEVLKKAALVVVPLRLGGGTRIKILESWAASKAVVSTSIGAEGVDVADSSDIVLADSPRAFADAVVRLLRDDATRSRIGQAAFKKTVEYYDPQKIISGLEKIYRETLEYKTNKGK